MIIVDDYIHLPEYKQTKREMRNICRLGQQVNNKTWIKINSFHNDIGSPYMPKE